MIHGQGRFPSLLKATRQLADGYYLHLGKHFHFPRRRLIIPWNDQNRLLVDKHILWYGGVSSQSFPILFQPLLFFFFSFSSSFPLEITSHSKGQSVLVVGFLESPADTSPRNQSLIFYTWVGLLSSPGNLTDLFIFRFITYITFYPLLLFFFNLFITPKNLITFRI